MKHEHTTKPHAEKNRAEAFSDGVFAVALTLLVLEIKVPHPGAAPTNTELARQLLALWPSFLAFALSFATALVMWVSHHGLMNLLRGIDRRFLFANGLLLFVVSVTPFSTALLAGHLDSGAANTAAVAYCGTFLLASIGFLVALYAGTADHLVKPALPAAAVRRVKRAYWLGFVTYLVATALAAVSAWLGVGLCAALLFVWATLRYSDHPVATESTPARS